MTSNGKPDLEWIEQIHILSESTEPVQKVTTVWLKELYARLLGLDAEIERLKSKPAFAGIGIECFDCGKVVDAVDVGFDNDGNVEIIGDCSGCNKKTVEVFKFNGRDFVEEV